MGPFSDEILELPTLLDENLRFPGEIRHMPNAFPQMSFDIWGMPGGSAVVLKGVARLLKIIYQEPYDIH